MRAAVSDLGREDATMIDLMGAHVVVDIKELIATDSGADIEVTLHGFISVSIELDIAGDANTNAIYKAGATGLKGGQVAMAQSLRFEPLYDCHGRVLESFSFWFHTYLCTNAPSNVLMFLSSFANWQSHEES